jgi:hypothetical protein
MADNFNLRQFLTENKLTKNAKLLNEARVEGFDENQKAFEVTFINKYGGGDSRILNAETPEQAEEVFNDIFVNNPDFVQSIKSVEPYQVPAAKPQAEPQPGLEGVNYNSIELDGIDSDDYPDFVDAYVISAEFEDGTPLSEEELEQLTDELHQSGELSDMAAQSLYENKKKPVMENLTAKERRLVEMVNNAMGIQEEEHEFGTNAVTGEPLPNPNDNMVAEDEMVQDKPLPKYESIEELMKEIEHGTNEAAHNYKMEEMKRVYEALEAKVGSLEEGEHAEHIDQKAVKQMRKDIAALRKAEEKLRKEFEKKFTGKEKKETPAKEKATEALQENKKTMENFNLKKFLTENKLTTNSRMISEIGRSIFGLETEGLGDRIGNAVSGVGAKLAGGNSAILQKMVTTAGIKVGVPIYSKDGKEVYVIKNIDYKTGDVSVSVTVNNVEDQSKSKYESRVMTDSFKDILNAAPEEAQQLADKEVEQVKRTFAQGDISYQKPA